MNSTPVKLAPWLKITPGTAIILNTVMGGYLKSYNKKNQLLLPIWSEWTDQSQEALKFSELIDAKNVASWWKGSQIVMKPLSLTQEEEKEEKKDH